MNKQKNNIRLPFTMFLFFSVLPISSQELVSKQKEIVHTEAINLLKQYEQTLNNIANSSSSDATRNKYKNEFIDLFLNRQVLLFNDIEPSNSFSEFYEAENYIANLLLWYPDGLLVNLDSDNLSTYGITQHKENIYYLDILVKKQSKGNFMNQQFVDKTDKLSFRMAFVMEGKRSVNYKFVGIRKAGTVANNQGASLTELKKVEVSKNEQMDINRNIKMLMLDYIRALEFLGNPNEQASDKEFIKADFLTLFESESAIVFNDITPDENQQDFDIKTYTDAFTSDYPDGITNIALNIDSASFAYVERQEEETYKTSATVKKFFSGQFNAKQAFKIAIDLQIIIVFEKKEGSFSNYKIKSIDRVLTEYSDINKGGENVKKEMSKLKPVSLVGNSIGVFTEGGASFINNRNLSSQTLENNYHEWKTNSGIAYSGGLAFVHFRTNKLGVQTGLGFTSYNSKYSLTGKFTNGETSTDINNIPHTQKIDASYDSTVNLNYLSFPIHVIYIVRPEHDIKFYINTGINASYCLSANYSVSGNFRHYGNYEDFPSVAKEIDNPGLGFRNEQNIHRSGNTNSDKISIMATLGVGVLKRIGYFGYLKTGPTIGYELFHTGSSNTYTNVFGSTTTYKPTKILFIGLQISYLYAL